MISETVRVTKAAGIVGGATFLSRILGYIRDMVVAGFFGAGFHSDAFFAAFIIPNLLRRLFAEGSFTIAFIPVFTQYFEKEGRDQAFELARSAVRVSSVVLVVVTLSGMLLSPLIVKGVAFGFLEDMEKYSLTVYLTRLMFPYIFFICLVALCMGILNALGHFAAPSLAPVFLNIAMIGTLYGVSLYSTELSHRVIGLAAGVIIGGFLQLLLQVPYLIKNGFYFWERARFFHPALKKIGLLMLPAVFGSGIYQINAIVTRLLASLLPEGSISYLYYADRLVQFPLGIFAIAVGTAVLPSLSRQVAVCDIRAVKETFGYAMRLVFFIMVPAMVGLIVLREPVVALLFERGKFDAHATRMTADALIYFAIGIWAIGATRVIVPTFYALQDSKTPVMMAIVYAVANIVLGLVLMRPLGHGGLALSISIASILHFFLLLWALRRKLGQLGLMGIVQSVCKTVACSAMMGYCVWTVSLYIIPSEGGSHWALLLGISGSVLCGLITYGIMSYFTKSHELKSVLTMIGKG